MTEFTQNNTLHTDNEISLYDLYCILAEKKALLISCVLVALLAAIVYLIITPPIYEVKCRLLLPKANMLKLSTPDHPYTVFDAKLIFQDFQSQLRMMERWQEFVSAHPELFPNGGRGGKIDLLEHPIKFSIDKKHPVEHIDISYQNNNAEVTANIMGRYLQSTHNEYVTNLINEVKSRIDRQRVTLTSEIVSLRKKAHFMRVDEIERLRKDIILAQNLGIVENLLMRSSDSTRGGKDVTIIASSDSVRNYMRGTKALSFELDFLTKRKSDDPYTDGLRDKQIELERLAALQFTPLEFKPYIQDGEILVPNNPIKPNKSMTLILAIFIGGLVGVVWVLLVNAIKNTRH